MITARADTLTFQLPESLYEVTFGQAQALANVNGSDFRQILLILSCKTEDDFRVHALPLRRTDLAELINTRLSFIFDLPTAHTLEVPKKITLQGKTFTVPQKLGVQAVVAQWWDIEDEIRNLQLPGEGIPLHLVAPLLLSVFLVPLLTGEPYTDIEQAHAIMPVIETLPCTQALPLAAFFLSKYSAPMPCGINFSPSPNSPMTMWRRWRNRLRQGFRVSRIIFPSAS